MTIKDLDPTYPDGQQQRGRDIDDDIRALKTELQATFPNENGPITPTSTEINHLGGITSNVQAQIDSITSQRTPAGSGAFWGQAAAPTGWTQDATYDDRYLRVRSSGAGLGVGGSHTISGLTVASHSHSATSTGTALSSTHSLTVESGGNAQPSNTSHSHTLSISTTIGGTGTLPVSSNGSWKPRWLDVIYCIKAAYT